MLIAHNLRQDDLICVTRCAMWRSYMMARPPYGRPASIRSSQGTPLVSKYIQSTPSSENTPALLDKCHVSCKHKTVGLSLRNMSLIKSVLLLKPLQFNEITDTPLWLAKYKQAQAVLRNPYLINFTITIITTSTSIKRANAHSRWPHISIHYFLIVRFIYHNAKRFIRCIFVGFTLNFWCFYALYL